jgi:hypothetical protein
MPLPRRLTVPLALIPVALAVWYFLRPMSSQTLTTPTEPSPPADHASDRPSSGATPAPEPDRNPPLSGTPLPPRAVTDAIATLVTLGLAPDELDAVAQDPLFGMLLSQDGTAYWLDRTFKPQIDRLAAADADPKAQREALLTLAVAVEMIRDRHVPVTQGDINTALRSASDTVQNVGFGLNPDLRALISERIFDAAIDPQDNSVFTPYAAMVKHRMHDLAALGRPADVRAMGVIWQRADWSRSPRDAAWRASYIEQLARRAERDRGPGR